MARYIDADLIKRKLKKESTNSVLNFVISVVNGFIDEQPTADVVEVVRCFQCKHLNQKGICEKFRQRYPFYPENDFYCGYGERKCDEW